MEVVRGLENAKLEQDTSLTVGSFDGVHLGHQRILRRMQASVHTPATVITFDPHPQVVVRSHGDPPPQIMTFEERIDSFEKLGLDRLIIARFDADFARISADDFIENILIKRIGISKIFVGPRHGFGAGRRGDIHTLNRLSEKFGFAVEVVPPVIRGGGFVSSSRIRKCIQSGDVLSALHFLGKPFYLRGKVIVGDRRGVQLGFPTANIERGENVKISPSPGVYASITEINGVRFPSVSHIGARPTIEGAAPSIETHIIGFNDDIYGDFISIGLIALVRGVIRFDSLKKLSTQIERDRDRAIEILTEKGFGQRSRFPDRRFGIV